MKPNLIIVAGPNGSGKTTITEKLLRHKWMDGCTYINPDILAEEKFGGWNSLDAIVKAANYAEKTREQCLAEMRSMAFETVYSIQNKVDFVKRAKDAGFFVRFFFICTNDPSINAQRVALRVMEGGHDVPITKIVNRYYRSIANCATTSTFADRVYLYDNSITDCDPKLLCKFVDGEMSKTYTESMAPWVEGLL